jgi:hypothetical protein
LRSVVTAHETEKRHYASHPPMHGTDKVNDGGA